MTHTMEAIHVSCLTCKSLDVYVSRDRIGRAQKFVNEHEFVKNGHAAILRDVLVRVRNVSATEIGWKVSDWLAEQELYMPKRMSISIYKRYDSDKIEVESDYPLGSLEQTLLKDSYVVRSGPDANNCTLRVAGKVIEPL